MRKMKLLYSVTWLLILVSVLLSGCSSSSSNNDSSLPAGAVEMDAITTTNPDGNIQATVGGVTISSPPVVTFALSDENGKPINPIAMLKENSSNRLRFYLARLNENGQYVNYLTNAAGTAPSYDSNASAASIADRIAEVKPGVYTYTFVTDVKDITKTHNVAFDATKTHTVVIQIVRKATKNAKNFDQISNPYLNFRPDGQTVTATREIVSISACNQCHGKLALHGGSRIEIALCIVCHTVGYTYDGTANTPSIDMKNIIHKIHMGAKLPTRSFFQVAGFQGFSTATFPTFSGDSLIAQTPVDCQKCHVIGSDTFGRVYGADVAKYKVASIENCQTCHSSTAFAGETTLTVDGVASIAAVAHTAGSKDNSTCVSCHAATVAEYDASVTGAHTVWEKSTVTNPGLVSKVISVTNVGPGKYPRVTFQVTDARGNPLIIDPGTVTPNVTSPTTNNTLVYANDVTIHMAIKPTNIPDFLNAKLATDDPLVRYGSYGPASITTLQEGTFTSGVSTPTTTGVGSGSTSTVKANYAAYITTVSGSGAPGALGVVNAAKGIYFVNFSTSAFVALTPTAAATVPIVTFRPNKLPALTGDYSNGATIAFGVMASRIDTPITHRGNTTQVGTSATVANVTLAKGIVTTYRPINPSAYQANVPITYVDLATGAAVIDKSLQRRVVVDNNKCKTCHNLTPPHNYRTTESCVFCHNPNRNDENFAFLIHRYHTGEEQRASMFRRYAESKGIVYPSNRLRCNACHIEDNPTPIDSYPAYTTFNAFANGRIPTFASACIGCHDTAAKNGTPVAHATANSAGFFYTAPTAGGPALYPATSVCNTCHTGSFIKEGHQLPN